MDVPSKICNTCGEGKPLEEGFHHDHTQKDGFKKACKSCRSKHQKQTRTKAPKLTTLETNLESKARGLALRRLIENHPKEFNDLVGRYRLEVGIPRSWVEMR